jgi:hypothetical protein
MDTQLVVVRPFAGFARGAVVTDPAQVKAILAGEHALNVVRVLGEGAAKPQSPAPLAGKQGGR